VRTAIEKHEGFLFSHTGDGVVAAFTSPRSAVDAAVATQQALELPVRMGIATGEAELRGGDYFGTVLNRAARHARERGVYTVRLDSLRAEEARHHDR
jgi:class 3 adenylate cyclase